MSCDPSCPGWGYFNGCEIQRCDECGTLPSDECAQAYVRMSASVARNTGGPARLLAGLIDGPFSAVCMDNETERDALLAAFAHAIILNRRT